MKVGFIGLGVMGGAMARHIATSPDFETVVFDVDTEKIAAVVAAGATGAATIAEVADRSEVVLLSLPTTEIVTAVIDGDDGLASHLAPGSTVIDTSTTAPEETRRLSTVLAERDIGFLDAPVSGGEGGAKAATLSIMVGGPEEVFDRFTPVLNLLGGSVVRVGEVGAGEVAKLINNMIVGSAFAVIAESFALGKTMGLDPDTLYRAIRGGWAGSPVLDVAGPGIANRDFVPGGSVDILFKDMGYALSLARNRNVPTPMTSTADEIYKAARATGRGPQAQQVIIQLWEDLLGI